MNAQEQGAAIFNHYFAALAQRAGLRWTERNRADIDRAVQLLAADEPADSIPPYQPAPAPQLSTRVTAVLEREPASRYAVSADDLDDPGYQAWRRQRQQDEQTRRMLQREAGHR